MTIVGLDPDTVTALIGKYADVSRKARDGYLTDFIGVSQNVSFFPATSQNASGMLEDIPNPFDDTYFSKIELPQIIGLLLSIEHAGVAYKMISLGAGYGEWALKARKAWSKRSLFGDFTGCCIEADESHIQMIYSNISDNAMKKRDFDVRHAAIASIDGVARFPKLLKPTEDWGASVVAVAARPEELDDAMVDIQPEYYAHRSSAADGAPVEWLTLPAIGLTTLLQELGEVDYLHSDLQNSEVEVLPASIGALSKFVKMVSVETHSYDADARITDVFQDHGWISRYRRAWGPGLPDGTSIWFNSKFW